MDTSKHRSGNEWASETDENDSEDEQLIKNYTKIQHRRVSWFIWISTAINVALFAGTLFLITRFNETAKFNNIPDIDMSMQAQSYSPVLNHITPETKDVVFNGSFVNYPSSIFRSDPSEEVNRAWDEISDVGWILITEADVLRAGKDPKISSKAPQALLQAMGKDSQQDFYLAQIDVFHQLHCLNEIRHHVYWDHYHRRKWGAFDEHTPHPLHWTHISHCINAIRENIMCNADVSVITATWTEGQEWPFPDFNLNKKCRNFDQIENWQAENRVPKDLTYLLATPDDVELQTLAEEVYHALHEPIPNGYPSDHDVPLDRAWDSSW